VTLAILAAAGVAIAGSESSNLDLVGVTVGVLVVTLVFGSLFVQRRALLFLLSEFVRLFRAIFPRASSKPDELVGHLLKRLDAVKATPVQVIATVTWGFMNWILDCGCLVVSFYALGVAVPWRGLLLAYGAGQLAANLPITPGGLGVVEGSITVALVAYGGLETSTVAAVVLYRIISFWGELPIGWVAWALLSRKRRRRHHEDAPSATGRAQGVAKEVVAQ
jgi:putative heme transporter